MKSPSGWAPPETRLRLDWLQLIGENLPDWLQPEFLRPYRVSIRFLDWNSGWDSNQSSDAWRRALVAARPPARRHLVQHTHLSVLDRPTSADRIRRDGCLRDGRGLTSLVHTLLASVDCLHLVLHGMARLLPDMLRTAAVQNGLSLQVQAAESPRTPRPHPAHRSDAELL